MLENNISDSQENRTWDLWGGLVDESTEVQMQSNRHILHATLRALLHFITKFAKFPHFPSASEHAFSIIPSRQLPPNQTLTCLKNTVLSGTARFRPAGLHDMLMPSSGTRPTKGEQAPRCSDQKLHADREQQSPVGPGNSPLLVHMQSVCTRFANSFLSSVDGANTCTASISKAGICCGHHREESQL